MAEDWIKMRSRIHDDPDVVGIAARLGIDEHAVVGRLHKLWAWADAHTTDGTVGGVTREWVDRYVGQEGFAEAMAEVEWLEYTELGLRFPGFDRHNGVSAKRRAQDTRRKSTSRANCPQDVRLEAGQNRDQRREEKNREEKELSPPTPPLIDSPVSSAEANAPANLEIREAFPKHKRGGRVGDLKAIARARREIEASDVAGDRDSGEWLLACVRDYAQSPMGQSKSDYANKLMSWMEQGYWDNRDAWQRDPGENGETRVGRGGW